MGHTILVITVFSLLMTSSLSLGGNRTISMCQDKEGENSHPQHNHRGGTMNHEAPFQITTLQELANFIEDRFSTIDSSSDQRLLITFDEFIRNLHRHSHLTPDDLSADTAIREAQERWQYVSLAQETIDDYRHLERLGSLRESTQQQSSEYRDLLSEMANGWYSGATLPPNSLRALRFILEGHYLGDRASRLRALSGLYVWFSQTVPSIIENREVSRQLSTLAQRTLLLESGPDSVYWQEYGPL